MSSVQTVERAVRHAVLRSGEAWPEARLVGLAIGPDGTISLRRVPALDPPVYGRPAAVDPSGIAADADCGLYIADTTGGRVLRVALDCGEIAVAPGRHAEAPVPSRLSSPSGLAVGPFGWLYVADAGTGRVLVFATPDMILRDAWATGLPSPRCLAADNGLWVYVLDVTMATVLRFDAFGTVDVAGNAALAAALAGTSPQGMATGADGTLYVSDGAGGAVLRLARDLSPRAPIGADLDLAPGAVGVGSDTLFVADESTGLIRAFSLTDGSPMGSVAGYQGPVAALTLDRRGELFVKPGLDATYLRAEASSFISPGTLTAGPLDAGLDNDWLKVTVTSKPTGPDTVKLEVAVAATKAGPPVWRAAEATDTLLMPTDRFLWLRVTLASRDPMRTPLLRNVDAATPGDSYLDYLPAVYSRDPVASDFLRRLLELARSQVGGLEAAIESLPRLFDPATCPAESLPWLASWLAFPIPPHLADGQDPGALRALLLRLHEIDQRRGTVGGLRDLVDIYTGTMPAIIESFGRQAAFVLDRTARLGFDTVLSATDPEGLVVGDDIVGTSQPEPANPWARDLLADGAHRFTVLLPASALTGQASREFLRAVIDAEKPAHTVAHLCLAEPHLSVGVQARVGVDAIVAGPPSGLVLNEHSTLNADSRLGDLPDGPGAVGRRDQLGITTRVG